MRLNRRWILTIGPVLLVATCYAIAAPSRPLLNSIADSGPSDEVDEPADSNEPLNLQCENAARTLKRTLDWDWSIVIHEPYVLAADVPVEELERHYEQTIEPTDKALRTSYFRSPPRCPITILICSSDARFRECNLRLDGQERSKYSGIYVRKHRRIIVNIASGEGTLAHELTHALVHADFPKMPEWFDEGLASLHEECEFSVDELRLIGSENWRQQIAREALHDGRLRLLEDVTSKRFGLFERANVDYAHVRSLCMYLQERGLLEAFYRTCQSNAASDPTGLRSLCAVAEAPDPKALDDVFRAWLIAR